MKYSTEQQKIIDECDKNLYIAAGPGSGKSTTLSRITGKILESPSNKVILITFTNKAARSIMGKVDNLDAERISGGTFHSLSYRTMRQGGRNFHICDENKKRLIIKRIFDCRKDKDKFERIYGKISRLKSHYPVNRSDPDLQRYQNELAKYNMLDFDDIINVGIEYLKNPITKKPSATHILVDELQDTSQNQLEFLAALQAATSCKMIGVGDDDQCIYEWRGARYKNVEDFIERFGAEVMELGVNFRSTSKIVHKSRQLIERNKDRIKKDLRSNTLESGLVHCYGGNNPWDEVTYVVSLLRSRKDMEVAILYRNRANKHRLEAELRRNNIKYTVNDSTEITDRSAFRCLISCLRMATGRYDIYDMEDGSRGLKRLAKGTIDKIRKNVKNANDIEMDSKVRALACDDGRVKSGTSELRKIQKEFKSMEHEPLNKFIEKLDTHMINSFDIPKEIKEFLLEVSKSYVATPSDVDSLINDFGLDPDDEVKDDDALIELSTIHGYKGCEREIVIVPWCNWDFKPDDNTKNILEAERRLFYVAVTRAKSELYLTYSGFMKPIFVRELMK